CHHDISPRERCSGTSLLNRWRNDAEVVRETAAATPIAGGSGLLRPSSGVFGPTMAFIQMKCDVKQFSVARELFRFNASEAPRCQTSLGIQQFHLPLQD